MALLDELFGGAGQGIDPEKMQLLMQRLATLQGAAQSPGDAITTAPDAMLKAPPQQAQAMPMPASDGVAEARALNQEVQARAAASRAQQPATPTPQMETVSPGRRFNNFMRSLGGEQTEDLDEQAKTRNMTAALMMKRDPSISEQDALAIVRNPQFMAQVAPMLFQGRGAFQLAEIYDEAGRKQKVLLDPKTGATKPIGGVASNDERLPQGYQWLDPKDHTKGMKRLPGFEDKIPGEVAGKVAMMNMARDRIKGTRDTFERDWGKDDLAKWAAANVPGMSDVAALSGDVGIAQRDIQTGIEAALRTMTGAAAPEPEVKRYARMFMPGPLDTKESAKQKIDGLVRFMEDAEKLVTQGRGTIHLSEAGALVEQAAKGAGVPSASAAAAGGRNAGSYKVLGVR